MTENNNNIQPYEQPILSGQVTGVNNESGYLEIIGGILQRWYVVLPIFIVIAGAALPVIWLVQKPTYTVQGAIHVQPQVEDMLSGKAEKGVGSTFMNTQARVITSDPIRRKVVDKLYEKKLNFFTKGKFDPEGNADQTAAGRQKVATPEEILKEAVINGIITATPDRDTEHILVSMDSADYNEAQLIVDAFIDSYMSQEVVSSLKAEEQKQKVLEEEKKEITERIRALRKEKMELAKQFGSVDLGPHQEMKLERVGMLYGEVTKYEAIVLQLQASVKVLEDRIEKLESGELIPDPNEIEYVADINDPERTAYVNADATVQSLVNELVIYKRTLLEEGMDFKPDHPEYKRRQNVLAELQKELDAQKEEVGKAYDDMKKNQFAWKGKQELANSKLELEKTRAQLELNKALKKQFEVLLEKEDVQTRDVGLVHLAIQEKDDLLKLEQVQHDRIIRRIQEMEMERKRPQRISVAYPADVFAKHDKRVKLSLAAIFGALAAGCGIAFLMNKTDKRLHRPADVSRSIDIRVIGTTTSMSSVKRSLLPGRVEEDFQTIRANLSVLSGNNGDIDPGKLVVTSPGPGEGKTTLAINLATSIAKSGKRVLLIDGDMKSPSIAPLLDLPLHSRGLQDLLNGGDYQQAICSIPSTGLDVLPCDHSNSADSFEVLASPMTAQYIDAVAKNYDHVIIDTPPLLAFPDAMMWSRMSDSVILSCFIGKTTTQQLKIAKDRLSQAGVNLVGTVLSNVPSDKGYYKYGYGYGYGGYGSKGREEGKKNADSLLIPMHKNEDGNAKSV